MSFEGNFSSHRTGARFETITKKRPYAIAAMQEFASEASTYGLRNCEVEVFEPTQGTLGFRLKDGEAISTLTEVYDDFLSQFQLHGEYATRDNSRVGHDEIGPYIELNYKDIVI